MDKDLLRIVIIVSGAVVFFGMLLLSLFQSRKSRRRNRHYGSKNPLDNIDDSLIVNLSEDDFDIIPLGSALDDDADKITIKKGGTEHYQHETPDVRDESLFDDFDGFEETEEIEIKAPEPEPRAATAAKENMPELIQFSLVAANEQGFNGVDLVSALSEAGLVYGDLKIFERLDDDNRVDFGVASMVKPGTFPEQDLHLFSCPGIVFFMQPRELDDPLTVFNDLISLIFLLSRQLQGEPWDAHRQPLTEEVISATRQRLSV